MRIFTLMLFLALLFMPVLTWAKGTPGVAHGVHNLSATGVMQNWDGTAVDSLYATNTEQICVFCHTPHGGSLTAPLWNRANPDANSFTHYNSVALSTDLSLSVNRQVSQESLICLSCHDGTISVLHVTNEPNDLNGAPIKDFYGGEDTKITYDIYDGSPGKAIGASLADNRSVGDLSDDHPISFSYADMLLSDSYNGLGPKSGTLKSVEAAEQGGDGVRFFGGAAAYVECSSCHDPHVNYILPSGDPAYGPFLIMSNSGSALCLACHTK
jgi:hypothetical protein